MRLIDADALKEHKVYSAERHEKVVPVANIDWMPTVDAVPVKHGYWDDSFDGITPFCSACHMSHRGFDRTPNYCPHCGAKMDLEETKDNGTDNP